MALLYVNAQGLVYYFWHCRDILWVQLVFLPYWSLQYLWWHMRWVWKFWILKEDYGEEEKHYIIRKLMGLSHGQFEVSVKQ